MGGRKAAHFFCMGEGTRKSRSSGVSESEANNFSSQSLKVLAFKLGAKI